MKGDLKSPLAPLYERGEVPLLYGERERVRGKRIIYGKTIPET